MTPQEAQAILMLLGFVAAGVSWLQWSLYVGFDYAPTWSKVLFWIITLTPILIALGWLVLVAFGVFE